MMKQRIRLAAVTFLLLVGSTGGGLGAGERLTMVVTPSKSMAPATIRVRVGVEPDADNRVLNVIADSGAYYRSSEIQLDGDRAPRLLVVEFPSLPGGSYTVQGMLRDENGRRSASVIQEIRVVPSAGERPD
jgi:hypothetical protein